MSGPNLQNLKDIRTKLDELRSDRSKYIKYADVESLFSRLNQETAGLKDLQGDAALPSHDDEKTEATRALEEVLLLMSLTYMAIGKNNEPPAVYAILVVIKILLHHLIESGVYSKRDLNHVDLKFEEVQGILERSSGHYDNVWLGFFKSQIDSCREPLAVVKQRISGLSPQLDPIYEKLVSLRRQITAIGTRPKFSKTEIQELQDNVIEIEASRVNGKFLGQDGSVPEGQELVEDLINQCNFISSHILSGELKVSTVFDEPFTKLRDLKGHLEKLALTQAWSLRETDLFDYLQDLRKVDRQRVEGRFIGSDGTSPDEGQKYLLYLLRKSYATIYELLSSSKPISESLQPIYNQLSTLKKCLLEVQHSGGISSPRDLFPFSIKLASIDNLRKDGKFYVGNEVPEGQGSINGLLEECYEICHELRCQAEES